MKVTFTELRWRFGEDERELLDSLNVGKHTNLGTIVDIVLDFNAHEIIVHGSDNNFGCTFFNFRHITTGLERTEIHYATHDDKIGQIAIFPNGRVAVVVDSHSKAPEFAINKQRLYCYVGG